MSISTKNHQDALQSNYHLHEYRIEFVLSYSGFGITYLAWDTQLNSQVTIKEYFPYELASRQSDNSIQAKSPQDTEYFSLGLKCFLQEARTLAKFKHANIVRILRFFKSNNSAYIIMEYEHGKNLAKSLKQNGNASETELLKILPPLLNGLEALHNSGYLHLDIKPSNIYIRDKDGSPVLLGLGSARYEVSNISSKMKTIVTENYYSNNQHQDNSQQQGAWTDIYSLGSVLYYAISGKTPLDINKRLNAIINNKPDPLVPAIKVGMEKYSNNFLKAIDWALELQVELRPKNINIWRNFIIGNVEQPVNIKTKKMFNSLKYNSNINLTFIKKIKLNQYLLPIILILLTSIMLLTVIYDKQQKIQAQQDIQIELEKLKQEKFIAQEELHELNDELSRLKYDKNIITNELSKLKLKLNTSDLEEDIKPQNIIAEVANVSDEQNILFNENSVRDFIIKHFEAVKHSDINSLLASYADTVKYYKLGKVKKSHIKKDITYYFKRWPEVKNNLLGDIELFEVKFADEIKVKFKFNYYAHNAVRKRTSSGVALHTWILKMIDNKFKIISETQKILSRNKK
jgi:serine/threonine protein kinase